MKADVYTGVDGLNQNDVENKQPEAIRYLTNAVIYIDSINNDDQRIYRPYIMLTYGEKTLQNIEDKSDITAIVEVAVHQY